MLQGVTSWAEFEEALADLLDWKVQNMEGTPSDWTFVGVRMMEFTFLCSDNLVAPQHLLPPMEAGGVKKEPLPKALRDKHCCIDPPATLDKCLHCALRWKFLEFPGGDHGHYGHISHYVDNPLQRGKRPISWTPKFKEVPIDLSCLPDDRPGSLPDLTDWWRSAIQT